MQDEMTGQEVREPEVETGTAAEPIETNTSQAVLEQVKGERDQLIDRLARLQAEFENAR
jgi:molecular chaperone GrpE